MRSAADRAVENIAQRQYGVFRHTQALACGHTDDTIRYRLKSGRFEALHPRVYGIAGASPSWHRDQVAACFWSDGVASHRAAGFLWKLPGCDDPPLEITTSDIRVVPRCGIQVHHTLRMPAEQLRKIKSVPVTSVERSLLDLGAVFSETRVAMALDDGLRRGLTTLGDLDRCLYLTARRGRRGCAVLRRLVHRRLSVRNTPHSPLETLIFELLSNSSLPLPEMQHELTDQDGHFIARPDFVFPEWKLVIEGHSRKWHWGDHASSRDAARHNEITAAGFRVLYVTWADVMDSPAATLRKIELALREAGWVPGATGMET
ncbi:MAG TPA: hypothetical protein VE174_15095 [Actinomycetota bacterium]|nr:hypothetical protein [Actinomycetota bacterium]